MTTEMQRLECLGWKALDEGRDEDGRYCVLAESCGHFIISFAPTRNESWSAACSMALKDKDYYDVHEAAAEALGTIGPEAKIATPALTELLDHGNETDRHAAAVALGRIGSGARTAFPALTNVLRKRGRYNGMLVRSSVAKALVRIDATAAVPVLTDLLGDEDDEIRQAAAFGLGETGSEGRSAVLPLADSLQDKDGSVRRQVASALKKLGSEAKTAIPKLTDLLKDREKDVREAAASVLGTIGPDAKTATRALIELLKDKDKGVRAAAAQALGRIGPDAKTAIPALTDLLKDEDSYVRACAATALKWAENVKE